MFDSFMSDDLERRDQADDLEALPLEELRGMLRDREAAISDLEKEIAHLEKVPREFEERLARLERVFGDMGQKDIMKVTPAAYSRVGRFIKEDLGSLHEEDARRQPADRRAVPVSGQAGLASLEPSDLVLGQSYMPIDESLHNPPPPPEPEYLPASERVRASGMFVGPGGAMERRTLQKLSAFQSFWLDSPTTL